MPSAIRAYAATTGLNMVWEGTVSAVTTTASWVYRVFLNFMGKIADFFCETFSGVTGWTRRCVASSLFPAQREESRISPSTESECRRKHLRFAEVTCATANSITLKGVEVRQEHAANWIVFFPPFDKPVGAIMKQLYTLAEKTRSNLLAYDYRGIGRSEGKVATERELLEDAVKIVQELHKKQKLSKILLYGIELGGSMAAEAAVMLQTRGLSAHLVCEDTPPTLMQACKDARFLGALTGSIYSGFNWKLDAQKAIPQLSSRSRVLVITHVAKPTFTQASALLKQAPAGKRQLTLEENITIYEESDKIAGAIRKTFDE